MESAASVDSVVSVDSAVFVEPVVLESSGSVVLAAKSEASADSGWAAGTGAVLTGAATGRVAGTVVTTLVVSAFAGVDGAGASAGTGGSLILVPAGSVISPDHSLPTSVVGASEVVIVVSGVVFVASVVVSFGAMTTVSSVASAKAGVILMNSPEIRLANKTTTGRIDFFISHSKTT